MIMHKSYKIILIAFLLILNQNTQAKFIDKLKAFFWVDKNQSSPPLNKETDEKKQDDNPVPPVPKNSCQIKNLSKINADMDKMK
jgi:hypothetical protein